MALRVPPGSGELAFRDIARAWLVLLGWSGAACVEARPWTGAHFDRDDGGADAAVPDAAVPDAAIGDADYGLVPGPERDRPTPVTHSCAPPMGRHRPSCSRG